MSNGNDTGSMDKNSVWAAAQGRSFLRNELRGKSNEWVREFAGLVDDPETLDFLNHYCAIYAERGENFLETHMGREVLQNASTRMADTAFRAGNVSQLQGMVGLTDNAQDGGNLFIEAANRLSNEGAIGLVLGPPGSGKTATTLDVARTTGAMTGCSLIGNTSWEGFDEIVRSDVELLETMANIEGPVLAVIDETAQDLSGFGEDNKKAEAFSNSLTFVRKKEEAHGPYAKRGSVLMVNHTRTKTAKAFRDLCTFAIEKPSRSDPGKARLLESEGGNDVFEEEQEYKGLTDTRERYPEHEPSEFQIIGEDDDPDDVDDAPDPKQIRRNERIRSFLLDCKPWSDGEGISQKDAAEKAGYSSSWSTDRVKEWKRGEWNDLDGIPEPSEDQSV